MMPFARFVQGVAIIAVGGVVVLACGDDATPSASTTNKVQSQSSLGCGKSGAPKGLLEKQPISIKNNARTYDVFVPDAHDGKTPLPIVFVFHGSGGTGADIRKAYPLEGAADGKAIFVYPDGSNGEWNIESKADKNIDIQMFDAVLETISGSHCVDRKRIFATGYSKGGYFTNQLGCRRGSVIRAIAAHAAGGPSGDTDEYGDDGQLRCPEKPVAALVSHGSADAEVKLDEAQKSREHWRGVNGCKTGNGDPWTPAPCMKLAQCAQERPVVYCEVAGLGHEVWADGPKATWEFFSSL